MGYSFVAALRYVSLVSTMYVVASFLHVHLSLGSFVQQVVTSVHSPKFGVELRYSCQYQVTVTTFSLCLRQASCEYPVTVTRNLQLVLLGIGYFELVKV